jgi:tetratricopeptide (TPR) repeat protein
MAIVTRPTLVKAIAPIGAVAFICLGCLGSILYVNESNPALIEDNHWLKLDQSESQYADVIKFFADGKDHVIPPNMRQKARELATIYREQDKQDKAASIYRMLWVSTADSPEFAEDARALASIYTDMGAFPSAVESYQKILQYDRGRLAPTDPGLARDLNNLGQCYYTAACAANDAKVRHQYFVWAKEQFESARNSGGQSTSTERGRFDRLIIELNQKLVDSDLGHT